MQVNDPVPQTYVNTASGKTSKKCKNNVVINTGININQYLCTIVIHG
jgi:hypothetical protein